MSYDTCKRLIEIKNFSEEEKANLQNKLDIFLLNDRINEAEYGELVNLLNAK